MPELNEQQKKRYEEVREWMARKLAEYVYKHSSEDLYPLADAEVEADEILGDSRIAIVDGNQNMEIHYSGARIPHGTLMEIYNGLERCNFRRVLPKGEVK